MLYNFEKTLLVILLYITFSCKNYNYENHYKNFAIVTAKYEATKAGHKILKMGGNAFDAMIATDLALSVVYPNAGNLGGGGFLVYRDFNGKTGSLDFREKAPLVVVVGSEDKGISLLTQKKCDFISVSYTHLTLPTTD